VRFLKPQQMANYNSKLHILECKGSDPKHTTIKTTELVISSIKATNSESH
jgi:hypothetical protein